MSYQTPRMTIQMDKDCLGAVFRLTLKRAAPPGPFQSPSPRQLVRQLRGEAANQVRDCQIALAHNLGGTGVVSTVWRPPAMRRRLPMQ